MWIKFFYEIQEHMLIWICLVLTMCMHLFDLWAYICLLLQSKVSTLRWSDEHFQYRKYHISCHIALHLFSVGAHEGCICTFRVWSWNRYISFLLKLAHGPVSSNIVNSIFLTISLSFWWAVVFFILIKKLSLPLNTIFL